MVVKSNVITVTVKKVEKGVKVARVYAWWKHPETGDLLERIVIDWRYASLYCKEGTTRVYLRLPRIATEIEFEKETEAPCRGYLQVLYGIGAEPSKVAKLWGSEEKIEYSADRGKSSVNILIPRPSEGNVLEIEIDTGVPCHESEPGDELRRKVAPHDVLRVSIAVAVDDYCRYER